MVCEQLSWVTSRVGKIAIKSRIYRPLATLVNQLLQINPVPRPREPPGSDANNIVGPVADPRGGGKL